MYFPLKISNVPKSELFQIFVCVCDHKTAPPPNLCVTLYCPLAVVCGIAIRPQMEVVYRSDSQT